MTTRPFLRWLSPFSSSSSYSFPKSGSFGAVTQGLIPRIPNFLLHQRPGAAPGPTGLLLLSVSSWTSVLALALNPCPAPGLGLESQGNSLGEEKDFGSISRIRGCYGKAPVVHPRFWERPPRLRRRFFRKNQRKFGVFLEEPKVELRFWDIFWVDFAAPEGIRVPDSSGFSVGRSWIRNPEELLGEVNEVLQERPSVRRLRSDPTEFPRNPTEFPRKTLFFLPPPGFALKVANTSWMDLEFYSLFFFPPLLQLPPPPSWGWKVPDFIPGRRFGVGFWGRFCPKH